MVMIKSTLALCSLSINSSVMTKSPTVVNCDWVYFTFFSFIASLITLIAERTTSEFSEANIYLPAWFLCVDPLPS